MSDYEVTLVNDNSKVHTPLGTVLYTDFDNLVYVLYSTNTLFRGPRYQFLPIGKNFTFDSRARKRVCFAQNGPVIHDTDLGSTIHRRPLENPR